MNTGQFLLSAWRMAIITNGFTTMLGPLLSRLLPRDASKYPTGPYIHTAHERSGCFGNFLRKRDFARDLGKANTRTDYYLPGTCAMHQRPVFGTLMRRRDKASTRYLRSRGDIPWGHETLAATPAAGVLYIPVILNPGEQRIYSSYVSFEVALKTGSPSVAAPTAIVIVQANTIP
jgi:hypothetical protein